MDIFPIYRFDSIILVGLDIDFPTKVVKDSLVVEIDIETKRIVNPPWSYQKKLKFGYYNWISDSERESCKNLIRECLSIKTIGEVIDALQFPSQESIDSLIWIPERLKKIEKSIIEKRKKKYDIKKIIRNLIDTRHKLFSEALNYAMQNELKSINDVFEIGEAYEFNLRHLDNSKDTTLQLLVDLIKSVERTTESIANLNSIDLDEFNVYVP